MVERDLAKVDVVSSNLITRSTFPLGNIRPHSICEAFFVEFPPRQVAFSSQHVATISPDNGEIFDVPSYEMPRISTLEPTQDKKKVFWYICISAEFSNTGKWKREYFSNRDKARKRSAELQNFRKIKEQYAVKASPRLIGDAVECDERSIPIT